MSEVRDRPERDRGADHDGRNSSRWPLAIPFVGAATIGVLAGLRDLHVWTSGRTHLTNGQTRGMLLFFGSFFLGVALLTLNRHQWRWQTGRSVRFYKRLEPISHWLDPGATGPHDTIPQWRYLLAQAPKQLLARAERRRDSRLSQLRTATYAATVGITIFAYALLR